MMKRRQVLAALGIAPIAAPKLIGETIQSLNGPPAYPPISDRAAFGGGGVGALNPSPSTAETNHVAIMRWLRTTPSYISELRDSIAAETHVTYIDADLLAMRSLSTAARIYYMRQRLIDRQLSIQLEEGSPCSSQWKTTQKWMDIGRKALGL